MLGVKATPSGIISENDFDLHRFRNKSRSRFLSNHLLLATKKPSHFGWSLAEGRAQYGLRSTSFSSCFCVYIYLFDVEVWEIKKKNIKTSGHNRVQKIQQRLPYVKLMKLKMRVMLCFLALRMIRFAFVPI